MADALQVAWLPKSSAMPLARSRVVGTNALPSLGNLSSDEVDLYIGVRATTTIAARTTTAIRGYA